MTCKGCFRDLVRKRAWYALDGETRRARRAEGFIAHYRGGMCERCWKRRKRGGGRTETSRETMLAEFDFYRLFGRSQAENCRRTAKALGISPKTVERAILRAKKDGQL